MDFSDVDLASFESLIRSAFLEDFAHEDITTQACFPEDRHAVADLILKKDGVIAGLKFLPLIFSWRESRVESALHVREGERREKGTCLGTFSGPIHALLSAERTACRDCVR